MRKLTLGLLLLPALASAQNPDITYKVDIHPTYTSETGFKNRVRWFDGLGRISYVGVGVSLDRGYYLEVKQRLQRIPGDLDQSDLDEAYIEDPGTWRLGKQYLPLGNQNLLRESAVAARYDVFPRGSKTPIKLAVMDSGSKRQRGAMISVGGQFGIGIAAGHYLGATGTSLATMRDPQSSPGPGHGYRRAVLLHANGSKGPLKVAGELLALRDGHQTTDKAMDISDVSLRMANQEQNLTTTVGWTREWRARKDLYRVESELKLAQSMSVRSFVRFERGSWKDLSVSFVFKP